MLVVSIDSLFGHIFSSLFFLFFFFQALVNVLETQKSQLGVSGHEITESGSLTITLDREHIIRNYIGSLVSAGQTATSILPTADSSSCPEASVVLNVAALLLLPAHASMLTIDSLRVVLAAQHLANVLKAQG